MSLAAPPSRFPPFVWDRLDGLRQRAARSGARLIDLTKGAPVDVVPGVVRAALAAGSAEPGYPTVRGELTTRVAAADWLARRHGVVVEPGQILPTIGSKELIGLLPALLGLGPGDVVVHPSLAYPAYAAGAQLVGASPVAADDPAALSAPATAGRVRLIWLNSPGNPTGRVQSAPELREVVAWAREAGAVVASDECYLDLGWEEQPVSVLHHSVSGGSHRGLLAVHSLSKRSNLAGYRAGLVTGDVSLIDGLREVRRHLGLMCPTPIQRALAAALTDDDHADGQRGRYLRRRHVLRDAFEAAGWSITHSTASLFLWIAHPQLDGWAAAGQLADAGILVTPGDLYGPAGGAHIRVAITARDDQIAAVAARLWAAR